MLDYDLSNILIGDKLVDQEPDSWNYNYSGYVEYNICSNLKKFNFDIWFQLQHKYESDRGMKFWQQPHNISS